MASRVLVTAALPYANGSIHLGHILEAVQTDVYVRARKLAGEDVVFAWASDTHGTPIQVRAQREGITPEALIARAYDEHVADYRDFGIGFDIFHTTHSAESKKHVEAIFSALQDRGDIAVRSIEQLFCPAEGMFLADRFVRGTCPFCAAADQYGDVCERCNKTYAPTELIAPLCAHCGATPVLRESDHLFVPLAPHADFLRDWLRSPSEGGQTRLHPTVRNYVQGWLDEGLRDWDISREAPYFGFEIPGYPGKYFYVWFDAPIGYIAATDRLCQESGRDFAGYWNSDRKQTEIVHVIGKDIVYFHCLFWPAMLHAAGLTEPTRIQVHGWLQVNGDKMSKSRGTFVLARAYLEHLPPDFLRYYFASKLSAGQDDIDLDFGDFVARVNADLVNKAANLASRCVKFLSTRLGGRFGTLDAEATAMAARAMTAAHTVPGLYSEFESAKALRVAMEIAEEFNGYLTRHEPWKLATTDPERARSIVSAGIEASRLIAIIFAPVMPAWAEKVARMLGISPLTFASIDDGLATGHPVGTYEMLAERVDSKKVEALIESGRSESAPADAAPAESAPAVAEPLAATVVLEAFKTIDLRVAKVLRCARVTGSDKLLELELDLGGLGRRTVFSGIAASYTPEALIGKNVVVFANLAARKMRFGTSEGMILAAGTDDAAVTVLELGGAAKPGDRIS